MSHATAPAVSVIIPNYNYARYLEGRIASVLAQTCQDFELILLDDCSTDGSRDILDTYRSHPKVTHVVYNDTNSGSPFRQWLRGIALARGRWVWLAEADDLAAPDFLATCLAAARASAHTVLCYTQFACIGPDGEPTGQPPREDYLYANTYAGRPIVPAMPPDVLCMEGRSFVRHLQYWESMVVNASGVLFSRDAALRAGAACASFRACGDWLFWSQVALQGNVVYVRRPLNSFRKHTSQTVRCARQGTGVTESLLVMRHLEQMLHIPRCVRLLNHGLRARYIRHLPDAQTRRTCSEAFARTFGTTVGRSYLLLKLLRLAALLPGVPTPLRDMRRLRLVRG